MVEEKRTLKTEGKNDYLLTIVNEETRYTQQKYYSKDELKENHKLLKQQLRQLRENKATAKRVVKETSVEYTEQEKMVMEALEKFEKNKANKKALLDLEQIESTIKDFEKQCKEIEGAVPEVLRN